MSYLELNRHVCEGCWRIERQDGLKDNAVRNKYGFIHIVFPQNFDQSSKDITVWPILSSQGFFLDSFHQKLVIYFCFKHLLKNLNQGQYGLTHTALLEKFDQLLWKTHMARCCVFPIFLANSDQEAIQFDL